MTLLFLRYGNLDASCFGILNVTGSEGDDVRDTVDTHIDLA